ncbi:MAG: hypothetical protein IT317_04010 [Anaerolineales bacterium]|nr:hypothetical protein [Anaerolineales bacterium]
MTYPVVNDTLATGLVDDWVNLAKDWKAAAGNDPERNRLQKLLDHQGELVQARLLHDIGTIEQGFAQHQQTVARLEREAVEYMADAKQVTAGIKKDPTRKELQDQLKHFAKQIADRATAIDRDAHDYGDSWRTYRANPWGGAANVLKFPDKFITEFMARRAAIINDQKAIGTSLEKVRALKREADSLTLIVNKAAMKQGIKAGTGAQRPITDARKIAADGAAQIATLLADLKVPKSLQPKPDSITANAKSLNNTVTGKNWPKDAPGMKTFEGLWKNAEAGYKRMVTYEANMKKLYVNVQKGLRSTEMKDAQVKASLVAIVTDIKAAGTLLKAKAKDYASAKAAYPKIAAAYQASLKAKKK